MPAALEEFIRLNYTGPLKHEKKSGDSSFKLLSIDGQNTHCLVQRPDLLLAAERSPDPLTRARAAVLHQSLLEYPADALRSIVFDQYQPENLEASAITNVQFCLEAARAHLIFDETTEANEWLDMAVELSGFQVELTGAKVRATKHQDNGKLALVVRARSANKMRRDVASETNPKQVEHNSSLLFENPDIEGPEELQLADLDAACLLLRSNLIQRENPHHDAMAKQQFGCYIHRVCLTQGRADWCVIFRALWERSSLLELDSVHTLERATLQLKALSDALKDGGNISLFHCIIPLPKWELWQLLVERFMILGLFKEAIDIYEKLHMWSDAAVCCGLIDEVTRGLSILDAHVDMSNARQISIRGDLTQNPAYWETAWEIGKYGPAALSLGSYWLKHKDLGKASQWLNLSLERDPQNHQTLFTLGILAMEQEDWEKASQRFTSCVRLRGDDPKSWSNLASAFTQLGQYSQALHALRQALAVDLNSQASPRILANYVAVASRLGEWEDVLLGIKQIPPENVPSVLVQELTLAFTREPYNGSHTHFAFSELAACTIPQHQSNNAAVWRTAGKVEEWRGKPWAAISAYEKAVEHAQERLPEYAYILGDAYIRHGDRDGRIEGSKACPGWQEKLEKLVHTASCNVTAEWKEKLESLLASTLG